MSGISSFSLLLPVSVWIRSAGQSKDATSISMTCSLFLRIWSMHVFSILPVNAKTMSTARRYWSHRSIIYRMFTVPFPLLLRNPILYRVNCTRIPTLSILGTKKSCTMTAQTSISRSSRKTNCANTVKAKNTDQIQSWPWDCSWMQTGFLCLLTFFPETKTNRPL